MNRRAFAGLAVTALVAGALSAGCSKRPGGESIPVVAIANYGAHPIIDVTVAAFKARLAELGYRDGSNIRLYWSSVEGDVNLAPQMVAGLMARSPKVIVGITTPIAQAVVHQARGRVPVVFCGVTDPVGAGLVPSWENAPGSGVTGTSDRWPYAEQLDLIKELLPNARRVGVPFNSGEANSVYALEQIRRLAAERGLEIVTSVATNVGGVRQAVDALVTQRVDVIYVASDNTVMAGFESVLKIARERRIPLIVGESANVERGGLATYSVNYSELGRATADLVDTILKGASPGTLPVVTFRGARLYINTDAASRMRVTVPPALLQRATLVNGGEGTRD